MQRWKRGVVSLSLGMGLLGLVGSSGAQTGPGTNGRQPIVGAQPDLPGFLPAIPFCEDLKETLPSGTTVVLRECQLSVGLLCLAGLSDKGIALVCTNEPVVVPAPPPAPVPPSR